MMSEFEDDENYHDLDAANERIRELMAVIAQGGALSVKSAAEIERAKIVLTLNPDTISFVSVFVELRKNRPIVIEGLDGEVVSVKAIESK